MTIIGHDGRAGVLAFGDSITNGGGELQWGVALQSWVQWVARGLGLPFTNYAVDGATAAAVALRQIPAHRRINAVPAARYELGCVYIGVNDVRHPGWDAAAYERHLSATVAYLRERCDRLLTVTIPLRLGRPPAGVEVEQANAAIEVAARRAGALTLDLREFGGRRHVMADRVHPTALGQVAIAERALDVLAGAGFAVAARPSELISYEVTRRALAGADLRYACRAAKLELRALTRARRRTPRR